VEKLNPVAHRLDLPIDLEHVPNVFHILQLRKYVLDPDYAIATEAIEVTEDLAYEERPVQVVDCKINQLCKKQILLIKVLWANRTYSETIWKIEEDMRAKYPHHLEVNLHFIRNPKFRGQDFLRRKGYNSPTLLRI